ncbi:MULTISPECIES: capsid assembly protein [Burkholderia]|uniref:capsid assembly protein n=1 Tax=Burkholderia TaxID=32008 RepID=UPI0007524549|nr:MULTISPECIES: hypothetical protein [Burkholderia]AOJ72251.1 hypothetical protein WS78_26350 [Burkholderia savannae]KVG44260.1 hypothetical protein WS77_10030 [Burkholderia sp. MSMB0265]KVG87788.1 hypothetical protein WS81_26015 [Burkholderia sp. MSMB2040]KVG96369.1 hypothetical protein WS83_03140 [Burkholderia sp. MSMB2042]KVG97189.1 hypothetical protein WS82_30240 [Burkholderia sp. MSMB2041]
MTTDTINPNSPASPGTPETPALIPDSPEYRAAMIAAADASNGITPTEPVAKTDPAPADPNAPTPKLTDTPADEKKPEGTENTSEKKDGEGDAPSAYDFAKAFDDGSLVTEFNAEKPSDALIAGMAKALGISNEQVLQMQSQFRAGQAALAAQAEAKLFEAAGGKDEFNAVIAWGQKNLSQDQKVFYENLLNGPDAASAVGILKQRMQAAGDPALVSVTSRTGGAIAAFRDQSELVAAMADPRYQTSEAFRKEVADKLRISRI